MALIGPNGCGKSTLLKAVAGLLPSGLDSIRVFGCPVCRCRHCVAYLPQRGEIDWSFPISVERLIMTGRYIHLGWLRRPSRNDWKIVREVMDRLRITHLANRQIGRLSGGQQQRALFARALAQDAELLLLDEPLNAVDAETREVIYVLMRDLQADGKTLVVATHDLDRLAGGFDAVIQLEAGGVVGGDDCSCGDPVSRERLWAG